MKSRYEFTLNDGPKVKKDKKPKKKFRGTKTKS